MHRFDARRKLTDLRIGEFVQLSAELEQRRLDQIGELRQQHTELGTARFEEEFADAAREILAVYPQIYRRSMFLLLYGLVESDLMDACSTELEPRFDLKLKDLRDSGLRLVNTYVRKVAGISGAIELLGTEELATLGKIRNKFIHSYGATNGKEEGELIEVICKYEHYKDDVVVMSGNIHLGSGFLNNVASRFQKLSDSFYVCLKDCQQE